MSIKELYLCSVIYQLPNGKVIDISVEEFLDLTDLDIQFLMSINAGDYAPSPWYKSSVSKKFKSDDEEEVDTSLDYQPELDEPLYDSITEEPPLEDDLPEQE